MLATDLDAEVVVEAAAPLQAAAFSEPLELDDHLAPARGFALGIAVGAGCLLALAGAVLLLV